MSFRQRLAKVAPERETVITVGVFDGVHQGHRHLLNRVIELAGDRALPTVITFSNSPITVLRPSTKVNYLTTPDQRAGLLREAGIPLVVGLEFTLGLSRLSAREFTSVLVDSLKMKGLVMGPDTALGHNREGTFDRLTDLGQEMGFWVETVAPLADDGALIKSRNIREAVSRGEIGLCNRLLGRTHSMTGKVVVGNRQGREFGFPTANLECFPISCCRETLFTPPGHWSMESVFLRRPVLESAPPWGSPSGWWRSTYWTMTGTCTARKSEWNS